MACYGSITEALINCRAACVNAVESRSTSTDTGAFKARYLLEHVQCSHRASLSVPRSAPQHVISAVDLDAPHCPHCATREDGEPCLMCVCSQNRRAPPAQRQQQARQRERQGVGLSAARVHKPVGAPRVLSGFQTSVRDLCMCRWSCARMLAPFTWSNHGHRGKLEQPQLQRCLYFCQV